MRGRERQVSSRLGQRRQPSITIEGKVIPFKETPRLLGVLLDRQLTISPHVEKIRKESTAKLKLLAVLSNSSWGWRKDELRVIYSTFIRSKMDYAGSAWQPWLSKSNCEALERVQNKALRLITGQLISSPVEALRAEAGVQSFKSNAARECLKSFEKAKRLLADHPRRLALETGVASRNKRKSWLTEGEALSGLLLEGYNNRLPTQMYVRPPWARSIETKVYSELPGASGRDEDPKVKLEAAMRRAERSAIQRDQQQRE
jgi:hypothetical protein